MSLFFQKLVLKYVAHDVLARQLCPPKEGIGKKKCVKHSIMCCLAFLSGNPYSPHTEILLVVFISILATDNCLPLLYQ